MIDSEHQDLDVVQMRSQQATAAQKREREEHMP
jgi:hypothetical protein